jgi:uncharacterized membrane protein YczE
MKTNVTFYLLSAFFYTLGVGGLIASGIGASPYGFFTSNIALVGVTVGMVTIVYNVGAILLAGKWKGCKPEWSYLIYGVITGLFIDGWLLLFMVLPFDSTTFSIILLFVGVLSLDISKPLMENIPYPTLPHVSMVYAGAKKFKMSINKLDKLIMAGQIVIGIGVSFLFGNPFYNLGWGTLVALILIGNTLFFFNPFIEKMYKKLTKIESEDIIKEEVMQKA